MQIVTRQKNRNRGTMVQNKVKLRHLIINFLTSLGVSKVSEVSERTNERSGACKRSKQSGASEWVSGASEQAKEQVSGLVLTSWFLAYLNHSAREYIRCDFFVITHWSSSFMSFILWLFTLKNRDFCCLKVTRDWRMEGMTDRRTYGWTTNWRTDTTS